MTSVASRQFIFNWKVSLFAGLCLIAFINLGFWQLDREEAKISFIAEQATRSNQQPLRVTDIPASGDVAGLPVLLRGQFDEETIFLLDNRVLDGKVGFEVLQLFHENSDQRFIVNRGFVQMGRTRQDPIEIPAISGVVSMIKGDIYQLDSGVSMVHNGDLTNLAFPVIVQQIDIVQFGNLVGETIYPHVIRIHEDQPGALPRYWPSTVMQPEQHRGYAIQWFAMAVAVTLAWFFFSFRRPENSSDE